jgi:hypothetical protein
LYAENGGDLSTDFLLFNELFKTSTEKEVKKLSSYSELTKLTNITNLVRPDLAYSLATNKLNVNFEKAAAKKIKNICSSRQHFSIQRRKPIKNGESFYFRYRFQKTTTK